MAAVASGTPSTSTASASSALPAPAHSAGADVLSLRETAAEDATAGNGIAGYRPVPISVCAWAYRAASRYASSCAALRYEALTL